MNIKEVAALSNDLSILCREVLIASKHHELPDILKLSTKTLEVFHAIRGCVGQLYTPEGYKYISDHDAMAHSIMEARGELTDVEPTHEAP